MNNKYSEKSVVWYVVALLLLTPLIQIGYKYYLSIQMLLFLILIIILFRTKSRIIIKSKYIFFICILMMIPCLYFIESDDMYHYLLRSSREFLSILVLFCVLGENNHIPTKKNILIITYVISILAILTFGFTLIQKNMLADGVMFYLPRDLYILNRITLPEERFVSAGYFFRPSAFFGEPSYLAFYCTSLLLMVMHIISSARLKIFLVVILFLSILLSQSTSGVIASVILINFKYIKQVNVTWTLKAFMAMCFFTIVTLLFFSGEIHSLNRLANLTNPVLEPSGYYRMILPLLIISDIIPHYPFGVPAGELFNFVNKIYYIDQFTGIDNGLMNVIVNYGITSILIFYSFYKSLISNRIILIYLVLISMFNGSIFSFDKVVLVGITIMLIRWSEDFIQQEKYI